MTQAQSETRIEDLLASMTLEEKIGQLTMVRGGSGAGGPELSDAQLDDVRAGRVGSILDIWAQDGIRRAQEVAVKESRLGIPLLVTLDVLHGYETIFPIPLGEAAAFDPVLWEATARVAAKEAAAAWIDLTFAPMLDVSRDARWGRIAESPGEDPWVAARFAEAKVHGFQQGLSALGALAATAKHLGGYGAVTAGREYNSVDISVRSLHEVHLPPFVAAVRAGVAAIMPSFNDLAGVPMTAHTAILRDLVRRRWGFDGVMISDFSAVAELLPHGVAADLAEAAALALKAGVDIDMVSDAYPKGLSVALARGLIEEALIDEAVRRVLTLKARLGLLADPLRQHGRGVPLSWPEAHRDLARDAARRSIVLMQNRGDLLPLREDDAKHLAILGPLAENLKDMLGPWYAVGKTSDTKDFLSGIRDALPAWQIAHQRGTGIVDEDPASFSAALEAASKADIVLLCVGESACMCGEASSRTHPGVPQVQRRLAEAVFELGKPVIVVLSCGRPLTAPWLFERADAVLATWFLGSEAGPALADVLTGQCNPSGKLPVSWARDVGQMPIFYAQRPTGRPADADPANSYTSRYIDMSNEPQFPFGHGLCFTRFAYSSLRLSSATMAPGETITVEADIANEGNAHGEETAFLFIRDPVASVSRPVLELKGFTRIMISAGTSGTVRFELCFNDIAFPDEAGNAVLESGAIEVLVGPRADRQVLLKAMLEVRAHRSPVTEAG
jgi:beta-glucosidase